MRAKPALDCGSSRYRSPKRCAQALTRTGSPCARIFRLTHRARYVSLHTVANGSGRCTSTRRDVFPLFPDRSPALVTRSLAAGRGGGRKVPESARKGPENRKWRKEPDELMKTSHLKNATMPDPDECMKSQDLSLATALFPCSSSISLRIIIIQHSSPFW